MTDHSAALTYSSYLALDEILAAQRPRSAEHDEMLFIVIHQVYELWFKQTIHELAYLQQRLEAGDTAHALATLKRVLTILKTIVAQIDVLETMTPRQFTTFRSRLEAASGFQSAQFRELETMLGRRDERVLQHYPPDGPVRARLLAAMARPSLFDSLLHYLVTQGYALPPELLGPDRAPSPPPRAGGGEAAARRPGSGTREPSPAVQQVLLRVYRDDREAAQVCERFVDLDEGFQEWRYRHVKMVERTIGDKVGTGGSAGARYLRTTLFSPAFPDLWAIRSEL